MDATITITINIAAADKCEGNAEIRLEVPESQLRHLSLENLSNQAILLLAEAIRNYEDRNR